VATDFGVRAARFLRKRGLTRLAGARLNLRMADKGMGWRHGPMAVFKCSACGGAHLKIESPSFYWSGEGVFARVCSLTEIECPLELAGTLRAPLIHGALVTCLSELTFFRHVRDDVVG